MRLSSNLIDIFNSLSIPSEKEGVSQRFSVSTIPEVQSIKIGKDTIGSPCILIKNLKGAMYNDVPSIHLENLSVEFNLDCLIHQKEGISEKGIYSVVICREREQFIVSFFFRIMVTVIESFGEQPSGTEIYDALMIVVELFRNLGLSPRKSIQGLWAELFLIANSSTPNILLNSWHSTPEDRYDFCSNTLRIEVKSSSQRIRKHHFSLEQLQPPMDTLLLIASIFVERAGGGRSIEDLVHIINEKVQDPNKLLYLNRIISLTLGNCLKSGLLEKFDYQLAESSIAFFEYSLLPSINSKIPSGVSNVLFISDLSNIPCIIKPNYIRYGGIFEAALKHR